MNKTERQETVESLTEQLRASPNLYITDFTGLNVLRMTAVSYTHLTLPTNREV